MLNLGNKIQKRINELIVDNPNLTVDRYKYLFYLGLIERKKFQNVRKRAEKYLHNISTKIRKNGKITTNEVISALLAMVLTEKKEKILLQHLNSFLEKRIDVPYSPFSNVDDIFFLSHCYNLLSLKLRQKIKDTVNDRLKEGHIPIFEFVLISAAMLKINGHANTIASRLLSYDEEVTLKDFVYVEWFYQTILKKFLRNQTQLSPHLDNFIQNLRKTHLPELIESLNLPQFQGVEGNISPLNILELTLLYEATIYFGKDIVILTTDELSEKFKTREKRLLLSNYKWQNLFLFMVCFASSIALHYYLKYTPYLAILFFTSISGWIFMTRYQIVKNRLNRITSLWNNRILQHVLLIAWLSSLASLIPVEKLPMLKTGILGWIKYLISISGLFPKFTDIFFKVKISFDTANSDETQNI